MLSWTGELLLFSVLVSKFWHCLVCLRLNLILYLNLGLSQLNSQTKKYQIRSNQISCSVVSDSFRPHELQHTMPPCPSPAPRVHPNPCPLMGDAIQPSHPLLSLSPPALNLSQHQGLFQWVSSSHQVAKVLEFQLQHVLPMNTQDWSLGWTGWISLQSKGL